MRTRRRQLLQRSLDLRAANKDLLSEKRLPRDGLMESTRLRMFHGNTSRKVVRPNTNMFTNPTLAKLDPLQLAAAGVPYSRYGVFQNQDWECSGPPLLFVERSS